MKIQSRHDLTQTDLYESFKMQKTVLEQRIDGTEGEWKSHWQREHEALLKCLWVLGGEA